MSISTPDGEQRSANVVTVGGKAPKGGQKPGQKPGQKAVAAASKASAAATKSSSAKGAGPKKPTIQPVKVNQGRNWGPIALIAAVVLLAAGIIGFAAWNAFPASWESKAADIEGIVVQPDRKNLPAGHSYDPQTYTESPPTSGNHHFLIQSCMGNVYSAPIPSEHAMHSLEHGAVWITYQESLPADQVEKLAAKVTGQAYSMMSPYKDLDKPISLQAWGYQLKVDSADDPRIDEFITALRQNASIEPGISCSGGNTATGTKPLTEQQVTEKGLNQQ